MDSQVFQVDTKGVCLLCISDSGSGSEASPPNSVSVTGFKMFLRYLKIDFMDLGHFSSSLHPHLNGPDSIDVSVILCQRCSLVTKQFLQLFQEFEKIRLNLDNCAQKLHRAIREGQEDGNRIREYRKRLRTPGTSHISPKDALNASIAERLRDKALEKCALRLASSTPKILTTKISLPPLKLSTTIATTTTTNDGIIEKKSCNKPIFTNVEEVSSDVDDNTLDLHYEQEVEESDDVASPPPLVNEEPVLEEKSQSVFNTDNDKVISQPLPLPPKIGIANDVISAKVRTSPPPEQANSSAGISGEVVVSHSNANTGLLRPVKLLVVPIYVQSGPPIVPGSQAQSSRNHPEPSQIQDQDIQVLDSDSMNADMDMGFEIVSDNEIDEIPTNDPLDLDSEVPTTTALMVPPPSRQNTQFKPTALPNGKLKCPHCRKILASKNSLRLHRREMHSAKKSFRCQHCHRTYPRKRALVKHRQVIHAFLEFRDRFPVGTTEIELVTVVNNLRYQMREGSKSHRLPQKSTTDKYCILCEKAAPLRVHRHRKEHILCFHMDKVISNLERSKHKDNWSNPSINVQSVGYSSVSTTPTRAAPLVFKIDHEDVE